MNRVPEHTLRQLRQSLHREVSECLLGEVDKLLTLLERTSSEGAVLECPKPLAGPSMEYAQ